MSEYNSGLIISSAAAVLSLLLFSFGIWIVYRITRLLVVRLPTAVTRDDFAPRFVSAAIALLLTPSLLSYIVMVSTNIFNIFPQLISALTDWSSQNTTCRTNCIQGGLAALTGAISDLARRVVIALQPSNFPINDFVWFLLYFVLLYFGWTFLRKRATAARQTPVGALTPPNSLINVAFFALVVVSFYLCLSALLAIPLLKETAVAQGFSKDDLNAAIATDLQTEEQFDARFPSITADLTAPQLGSIDASFVSAMINNIISRATKLVDNWNSLRSVSYSELNILRVRGVEYFRTQSAEKLSGRETIEHYSSVLNWWLEEKQRKEAALADCVLATQSTLRGAKTTLGQFQKPPDEKATTQFFALTKDDQNNLALLISFDREMDSAFAKCHSAQNTPTRTIPPRPSRSESLKLVGRWTEWLLGTESLPLVIIVGLVGFSLLGATISRVVRIGDYNGLNGLGMADLLKVTAGGASAAMVIFLASYGGLAVLGESKTDPNPYVVFIACLIAAIFSEDVWIWARGRILGSLTAPAPGANPPTPPEPPQP